MTFLANCVGVWFQCFVGGLLVAGLLLLGAFLWEIIKERQDDFE
jgi:hypothetical protein